MKIFIVDDSEILRERIKELVSDIDGVDVIGEAEDVPSATASIIYHNPDVVILDIKIPGGSGIDVLKAIKQHNKKIKVLVLTNYPYIQYEKKCREEGAAHFFDKVTQFEDMLEVIRMDSAVKI